MNEPIRVLHVDDDPEFADLVATFLEREDDQFVVETAESASEGVDRLREGGVDCVVSDYDMPERNGIEFLGTVRDLYPDLPFVLYTGKGSEHVASEAFSAGATDYLQKDTGTEQYTLLANKIRNYVEKYEAERTTARRARAMETATEGIAILDDEGSYVEVNEAYAEYHGRTPADLLGEPWTVVVPDDEVERLRADAFPLTGSDSWTGRSRGLRADGGTFPKLLSMAALDDGGHVCIVRDITTRQSRERAIERLHTTVRSLMAADTPEAIAQITVEAVRDVFEMPTTGVHLYDEAAGGLAPVAWTNSIEELLGRPPTFAPGEGLAWETFETGVPQILPNISADGDRYNDDTAFRSEVILPLGDHGVLLIASPDPDAFDDTDVSLARTLAAHATTALDQTAREGALRRYERMVNVMDEGACIYDAAGRFEIVNDRLAEFYGTTRDALEGEPSPLISRLREGSGDRYQALLDGERASISGEVAGTFPDHGEAVVAYHLTPLRIDGEIDGVVGIVRDVTGERQYQQRLERLYDSAETLMHTATKERTAEVAVEAATEIFDVPISGFHLHDRETDVLDPVTFIDTSGTFDAPPSYERASKGPVAQFVWEVFESGEQCVVQNTASDPRLADNTPAASTVLAPLDGHGVFILSATERTGSTTWTSRSSTC